MSIFTLGEPILDPISGVEIGREETEIGSGSIVSFFGEDGSIVNFKSNITPKIGDICKIK